MSEKLFIEQRLITRKTPFMMLIITKLDQIPLRERKRLVDFVTQKLKAWGMDIPVYVPYNVEMPDDTYDDIIGIDKIKEKIVEAKIYDNIMGSDHCPVELEIDI